jgi:hypothetical protein
MAYVVGTTTITPHMKGDDPVKGVLKDILDHNCPVKVGNSSLK